MEKIRTIVSRHYRLLTCTQTCYFKADKNWPQLLRVDLKKDGGHFSFELLDLTMNKKIDTIDLSTTRIFELPIQRGRRYRFVIKTRSASGSYKVSVKTQILDKEKFFYEVPSLERKVDALEYINEFFEHGSAINGSGSLRRYHDDYERWLEKLERDYAAPINDESVPSRTYFLVRKSDNKIVGMANIRLALNDKLRKSGGHIGYAIRPTERRKGYNIINLYLALKVCDKYGIDKVLLTVEKRNIGSWKTMEALGGIRINEYLVIETNQEVYDYQIDVKSALKAHKVFKKYIIDQKLN